mmetsp:Transcript_18033/g.27368  ORF Transcript_18033/g.27368 Transcript_18033/m.27368 type:complete len:186 (+) Transcript_18033:294-851(+)|eukprot:CAMPEP_0194086242 /NCGR_PEP_ID=MMETSP0149-20130528/20381_1 /TAXON_ID=122233 /ORGANISM="Chaetoceros debilis, Strain MM31A-1" /LENGTH=185 /DNA_ID=CAMNT_0038769295 /DNA_START=219 /DNA_END=776 /DNA_ORIENTATION=+
MSMIACNRIVQGIFTLALLCIGTLPGAAIAAVLAEPLSSSTPHSSSLSSSSHSSKQIIDRDAKYLLRRRDENADIPITTNQYQENEQEYNKVDDDIFYEYGYEYEYEYEDDDIDGVSDENEQYIIRQQQRQRYLMRENTTMTYLVDHTDLTTYDASEWAIFFVILIIFPILTGTAIALFHVIHCY